jgi:uncharacterized protein YjbI with pentapeptide repeats
MADPNHLNILMQGADTWNKWREVNPNVEPDLRDSDLSGKDLREFNFYNTNLSGSNLTGVDFRDANLIGANLGRTKLNGANLYKVPAEHSYFTGADLTDADLREAHMPETFFGYATLVNTDLSKAILSAADFRGATLTRAKLNEARLDGAIFVKTDLTEADLTKTVLQYSDMTNAICVSSNLSEADLGYARLIETDFTGAELSNCAIYGISVWGVKADGSKQSNLILSREGEPKITVGNLEVAPFIYILLNNKKIRDVIDTITSKVVLILGRFSVPERMAVLNELRNKLPDFDYIPVIFDFDTPTTRDTEETITILARLSRFIIADITDPKSIPQELTSIVSSLPSVPVQPILETGKEPWGMYDHIERYPWVLEIFRYNDLADLLVSLGSKVIAPAEAKAKAQVATRPP